jgi:hypothetical protein
LICVRFVTPNRVAFVSAGEILFICYYNMSEYINIIKSNVVTSQYDDFWQDVTPVIGNIVPREVLIIVSPYGQNSTEELQLKKMLDACNLTPGQYNIIMPEEGRQVAWHQLSGKLKPKVVFLVGIMPARLGVSALFSINQPNHFGDCIWLPTLSLKDLDQYAEAKKQLWQNGMKPVFIDKIFG